MTRQANTPYDEVPYPDSVVSQTHPGRLGAIARLLGLSAAPAEQCRVLELGCGGGNNLIAMAHDFPDSTFLGVDLAKRPLELGRQLIQELKLRNVCLDQRDVCDFPRASGAFDYVIAHGLYSWVPDDVQERILAICRDHLTPAGVAFISYNAHPGSHLREIARGIMRYHGRALPRPEEQVKQGRALMQFLAEATPEGSLWKRVLQEQCERILRYSDGGLFHDDLSPIATPSYFHEFMERANRYELQFLAEAEVHTMEPLGFSQSVVELLAQLEKSDLVAKEQHLDFLRGRAFRQTLLCQASARLDRNMKPEVIQGLHVAGDTTRTREQDGTENFKSQWGTVIGTNHPVARAALAYLGEIWPKAVSFSELLCRSSDVALRNSELREGVTAQVSRDVAEFLVRCYRIGFVELQTHPSRFVTEVSERPKASGLARVELRHGNTVTNLRHMPIRLADKLGQRLVLLLDGTRDREALLSDLGQAVRDEPITVCRNGKPITEPQEILIELRSGLEANLGQLARMALLVS